MPRLLPVLATVFLLLAVLLWSGCDAGDPEEGEADREALIGTWSLDRAALNYYLTSRTDQVVIDPEEEGEGRIVVSGAVEAELSYLRRALSFFGDALVVASAEPLFLVGEFASEAVRLRTPLEEGGDFTLLAGDLFTEGFSAPASGDLSFDPATNTLRADEAVLTEEYGGEQTVMLDGSLQAATQPIAAGAEALVETEVFDRLPDESLTFAFNEDNTFTAQSADEDGETEETRGTWRIEDGELVLDAETGGDPALSSQRIRFDVSAGALRMSGLSTFDTAADSLSANEQSEALQAFEQAYGAMDGSLLRVRSLQDLVLRPAGEETHAGQALRSPLRFPRGLPWQRPDGPAER